MTPELQALTQRLEDVEKQVAHLEALAVEHSDTDRTEAARTVNAQRFVVTDEHGVRRAELGMSIPAGQTEERPWLGLFDADGNVRACVGVDEGGLPWLEFYDASQKSVLNVLVDERGPRIGLFYGNREPGVHVALSEGGPRMSLTSPNGQESVDLLVSGDGPLIMLVDANGKPVASVGVWKGRPHLTLHDPSGRGQLSLKVAPSGAKELFMGLGREAQPTVGPSLKLEVTDDGPCLKFGKDNRVFWSAP
ncbi:MAG TPA: hypothetical protein VMV34_00350 [Terriglobia bacterium]|nr:hypothetical protein [Terriglobia bacterium]